MAVANKIGKGFLSVLKKYFPPSSNINQSKKNPVKLSYSSMPDVANLINKIDTKKT